MLIFVNRFKNRICSASTSYRKIDIPYEWLPMYFIFVFSILKIVHRPV